MEICTIINRKPLWPAYSQNKNVIKNGEIDFLFDFEENARNEYIHPTAPDVTGLQLRLI
jgi:hypothetical protein